MRFIIKTQEDLSKYISENGDCDLEITYLSQNAEGKCFALFGCSSASEAFSFVNDEYSVVITDEDYEKEIQEQTMAKHPELNGFYLR